MKKPDRHHAFTLIELLTVIAIIGILAAIIIPTVFKARQSARRAQCFGNLKSVMMAAHMYANENKSKFPRLADPTLGTYSNGIPNPAGRGAIDLLLAYVNGEYKSFFCTGLPATATTYTYTYQNTRTDGHRFNNIGYCWLNSNNTNAFLGLTFPEQSLDGESSRVMMVCVFDLGNTGRPHDRNLNIAFADGHTGTLGKEKRINANTLDSQTMLLKK